MAKRSMFVGMDVHKESIDVSLAEEGRDGEVRHYGVIPGDLEAMANACAQPRQLTTARAGVACSAMLANGHVRPGT
jgi:hypothetical protein